MGDIRKGLNQFAISRSQKLKQALLEDLKDHKKTKQVIQLNGKSSLVFANLAALTLASCSACNPKQLFSNVVSRSFTHINIIIFE